MSIADLRIDSTPISIVDFETTGLSPGRDRVVEVSVVRLDPSAGPELVFDSLINPGRRVSATDIHGISDADVVGAPRFEEVAHAVADALADSVVAAYNVYFDMRFLQHEFTTASLEASYPHFCIMYMRPLLGIGPKCPLIDACAAHGISCTNTHYASADALASAHLLRFYLDRMNKKGLRKFGDLSALGTYKFLSSFSNVCQSRCRMSRASGRTKSRSGWEARAKGWSAPPPSAVASRPPLHQYCEAVGAAIADRKIEAHEFEQIFRLQASLDLTAAQIRVVHAQAFSAVLASAMDDGQINDGEINDLRELHRCLSKLGWAPGE